MTKKIDKIKTIKGGKDIHFFLSLWKHQYKGIGEMLI